MAWVGPWGHWALSRDFLKEADNCENRLYAGLLDASFWERAGQQPMRKWKQ